MNIVQPEDWDCAEVMRGEFGSDWCDFHNRSCYLGQNQSHCWCSVQDLAPKLSGCRGGPGQVQKNLCLLAFEILWG